jgi:prepilin-type N-terminal cleavage/methylation domain-containing protein
MKMREVRGFTLVEMMMAVAIFALAVGVVFQLSATAHRSLRVSISRSDVEGGASLLLAQLGRDVRESSYAYIFAGDWLAQRSGSGEVTLAVARNYFSDSPMVGGNLLVPGLAGEGWGQCPNPVCHWAVRDASGTPSPVLPHAVLARPLRNNPQIGSATWPPVSPFFSDLDAKGRLFNRIPPGGRCPFCGAVLKDEAFFSGLMVFSPRAKGHHFSYGGPGRKEVRWEAMIFYCPFRDSDTGLSEMRRYAFFASDVHPDASLADLLDFDGNGIIESPPMTDQNWHFVLDADAEQFCLVDDGTGAHHLHYARWDGGAGRSFRIGINRATAVADVTVTGGPYPTGGAIQIPLSMKRCAPGITDFDASTVINNPSWMNAGVQQNPTGVLEPGVVRVTFQVDKPPVAGRTTTHPPIETVQSTLLRPRN